jgi:Na+/H+ antiporter NhaD/arsenite permease-like protein
MTGAPAEALSAGMLVAVLAFAVVRAKGWPEAVAAVPAAVLVVAAGAVSPSDARAELGRLLPVVGFLAAVLVLATLRDHEGVFPARGAVMARMCRGRPLRLFGGVFVAASLVAAVLSLDATVVLLTPVVFATASSLSRRRTCRCGKPAVSGVRPGAGRDRPRVGGQRAGLARRSGAAGSSLLALLGVAAIAALLANLVNNLPPCSCWCRSPRPVALVRCRPRSSE